MAACSSARPGRVEVDPCRRIDGSRAFKSRYESMRPEVCMPRYDYRGVATFHIGTLLRESAVCGKGFTVSTSCFLFNWSYRLRACKGKVALGLSFGAKSFHFQNFLAPFCRYIQLLQKTVDP